MKETKLEENGYLVYRGQKIKKELNCSQNGNSFMKKLTEFTMGSLEGKTESSRIGNRVEF